MNILNQLFILLLKTIFPIPKYIIKIITKKGIKYFSGSIPKDITIHNSPNVIKESNEKIV